jgi:hypothetical protein
MASKWVILTHKTRPAFRLDIKEASNEEALQIIGVIAIGAVIMAASAVVLAGCDNGTSGGGGSVTTDGGNDGGDGSVTYTYTFSNNSSLSVHIEGSDLNPSDFYVGTGNTKTATSSKSNAFFAYDTGDAGDVALNSSWTTHTFTFSDK